MIELDLLADSMSRIFSASLRVDIYFFNERSAKTFGAHSVHTRNLGVPRWGFLVMKYIIFKIKQSSERTLSEHGLNPLSQRQKKYSLHWRVSAGGITYPGERQFSKDQRGVRGGSETGIGWIILPRRHTHEGQWTWGEREILNTHCEILRKWTVARLPSCAQTACATPGGAHWTGWMARAVVRRRRTGVCRRVSSISSSESRELGRSASVIGLANAISKCHLPRPHGWVVQCFISACKPTGSATVCSEYNPKTTASSAC